MAASRRLMKELKDLKENVSKDLKEEDQSWLNCVSKIKEDDSNIHNWDVEIKPDQPPFNKGHFKIAITFPAEYPFKPPKVTFKTKIYHPNIDEKGQVCLPIVSAENWKPATKTDQVIKALINLIHCPEPGHPLRGELAEEYTNDKKKFMKNAEDFTKKFAGDKQCN